MPTAQTAHKAIESSQFDPSKLADIQLPEIVSMWPLAWGWWILIGLLFTIIVLAIVWLKRPKTIKKISSKQLKSQAMSELEQIEKSYNMAKNTASEQQSVEIHRTIKELSIFLRRYILSIYPRQNVASVSDILWLQLLDETYNSNSLESAKSLFSKQYNDLLTQVPYQSSEQDIDQSLLSSLFSDTKELILNSVQQLDQQNKSDSKKEHKGGSNV